MEKSQSTTMPAEINSSANYPQLNRCMIPALLAVMMLLFASIQVEAQTTYNWTGNGDGTSWDVGGNWDPVGVPANADIVIFDNINATISNITTQPIEFRVINDAEIQLGDNLTLVTLANEFSMNERLLLVDDAHFAVGANTIATDMAFRLSVVNGGNFESENSTLNLNFSFGGSFTFESDSDVDLHNIFLTGSGTVNFNSLATGNITWFISGEKRIQNTTLAYNNSIVEYVGENSMLSYQGDGRTIGPEWPTINGPANVTIGTTGTITGGSARTIVNTLNFENPGTLDLGSNTLTVEGSVVNSNVDGAGTIADATTLFLGNGSGTNELQKVIGGTINVNKLIIDKSGGLVNEANTVQLEEQIRFTPGGQLTIENGILDLNGIGLRNTDNTDHDNINLIINSGGTLLTGGSTISGFNSYDVDNGAIGFTGSSSEDLDGFASVGTLIIDNSSSSGVNLEDPLVVHNSLELQQGRLQTNSNYIELEISATITGGSSASFVDGNLRRHFDGIGSKTFPVGRGNGTYRPAVFDYTAFSGGLSIIEVRYSDASFTQGNNPPGIADISGEAHYLVQELSGSAPSTFEYSFTGDYTDITLEPEVNIRLLVQDNGDYIYEENQTVNESAKTVTVIGLSVLPTGTNPKFVFGVAGSFIEFIAQSGSWFNTANWNTGSLPSSADEVIINEGNTALIDEPTTITVASLLLQTDANVTITSDVGSTSGVLEIGTGSGTDIVFTIQENASFTVNGGSGRGVLALAANSDERMQVFGTLNMFASDGLGSGTANLLSADRQLFEEGSTYNHTIELGDWLPAYEYGNLILNPSSGTTKELNANLLVHNDLTVENATLNIAHSSTSERSFSVLGSATFTGTDINFATGTGEDNELIFEGTFTLDSGSNLTLSNTSNFNTVEFGNSIFTSGGTITTGSRLIIIKLTGEDEQNIPFDNILQLDISGGEKTLQEDLVVTGELNLDSGIIRTNEHTLTIGSTSDMGSISSTDGFIIGNLRRYVSANHTSELLLPVGSEDDELTTVRRPARVTFTGSGPSQTGTLTASFVSEAPSSTGLPLLDDQLEIENIGVSGYWQILEDDLGSFTYDITMEAKDFIGVGNIANLRLLKRDNDSSPWELAGDYGSVSGDNDNPVITHTGLDSFSEFAVGGDEENPLPVELVSFDVDYLHDEHKAKLFWVTATELENYGFFIQRRYIGMEKASESTDSSWEEIDFVHGNGTTQTPTEYSYTDESLSKAGYYEYRLVQQDFDGAKKEYTGSEFLYEAPESVRLLANYPNPFNPATTIPYEVAVDGQVTIEVFDVLGRRVQTLVNGEMQPGRYEVNFDAARLSSGTYLVRMTAQGQSMVTKLMLLK